MISLKRVVNAWNTPDFNDVFKTELGLLDHHLLPLQKCLTYSSYVSNEAISTVIINTAANDQTLTIKANVFYTGIIAGCSCADDPSPQDLQNECCELFFYINRETGNTEVEPT